MKIIGIVGGIGPESTVDYYRLLLARVRERGEPTSPNILINSIDLAKLMALASRDDHGELVEYLVEAVERLADGGADLALFAANTPHIVFDDVQRRVSIPLVSIVTAAREAAQRSGLRRVGLLGTRFTMQGRFYLKVFAAKNIAVIAPAPEDQDYVHDKYLTEFVAGKFSPGTREGFVAVMDRMRERAGIDGVVLAGTELPLLLRDVAYSVPLLDTTRIHVDAVISTVFSEAPADQPLQATSGSRGSARFVES